MAENFDLIFGQNASQQYAWNDSDYQNGWETIGNIPPTAAQFDALQRRSDTKMKELNDELTPLVNAETADNRQPSTAYSEGDIKYSPLLPTGWFLACTVSGTSSASELVVPSPVAEGDEITDGGVTWKVKKIGGAGDAGDGVPLGAILPLAHNSTLPAGYLLCDGSAVSRTMFPDLFDKIGTTYGAGDGSTTFNLPDYNSAERFVQGSTVAGTVKTAGLPNITGIVGDVFFGKYPPSGAFYNGGASTSSFQGGSSHNFYISEFDASRSSSIYGNSTTVQPPALTARYIIKAYDGVTPTPAEADISQMLTELTGKATCSLDNLTQAGQDSFLERDFTIIYPNGGSEASPASITNNTNYVESNPFPGYYVKCIPEVLINGVWGDPRWGQISASPGRIYGVNSGQLDDGSILVRGGNTWLTESWTGPIFNFNVSNYTTLPCRVKVWKIGKIPTA